MAQLIQTNKNYKTPLGTITRYAGIIITVLSIVLAFITDWNSSVISYRSMLFAGIAVWVLGEVLDLYGGQWSKNLRLFLHATTAALCLAILSYICTIFGLDRGIGNMFLILGIGMEYILAGKMMKEERFLADSTSGNMPETMKESNISIKIGIVLLCIGTLATIVSQIAKGAGGSTDTLWILLLSDAGLMTGIVGILALATASKLISKVAQIGLIIGAAFIGLFMLAINFKDWLSQHHLETIGGLLTSDNIWTCGWILFFLGIGTIIWSLWKNYRDKHLNSN